MIFSFWRALSPSTKRMVAKVEVENGVSWLFDESNMRQFAQTFEMRLDGKPFDETNIEHWEELYRRISNGYLWIEKERSLPDVGA